MLKLIRLEMVKNNAAKYALYAVLSVVLVTPFLLLIDFSWGFEETDVIAGNAPSITLLVEMVTGIVFIVMSGVMHAAFTVNAYKNKTIDLMFSYPIKRKKILLSKIFAVLIFTFFALLIAQGIVYAAIHITGKFRPPAYAMNYDFTDASTYLIIVVKSAMAACISIMVLFIGMIKKSPVATIVSSFMSVALLQASIGQISLVGGILYPMGIVVISMIFAAITVSGVEKKDVI